MELDDLGRLEEAGGLGREAHHQDRADGEVRCDQHAGTGRSVQPGPDLGEAFVAEARGTDDHAQAVRDAPAQVVHHGGDVGEVNHDVAAEQRVAVVSLVNLRDQFHLWRAFDGLADGAAHPSPCAEYPNLDHDASSAEDCTPSARAIAGRVRCHYVSFD